MPDLTYRSVVRQQRQSQQQFLNPISERVQVKPMLFVRVFIDLQSQVYGTKYWTAVCDIGMVMESFANYLRYARSIGIRSADNQFDCKEYSKHLQFFWISNLGIGQEYQASC